MYYREPLTNGLVTTRDTDTLQPGELSDGANFWYLSNFDNIIQGPAFATGTLSGTMTCYGLAPAKFDNGNSWLLASLSTEYEYATVSPTNGTLGAWTTLETYASSTARKEFNSVQYNNKYYLFDGVQENRVLRQDGTLRKHGLKAVNTSLPALASATATANVWPAAATGYFDYWFTEVFKASSPEDIIIESSYEATTTDSNLANPALSSTNVSGPNGQAAKLQVASILVPALNTTVTIKIPRKPINSSATHFRLYRSEAKAQATDTSFPIGELIAEVAIPSASSTAVDDQEITIIDGTTVTSSFCYPSAIATASGWATTANIIDGAANYSNATYTTQNLSLGTGTQESDRVKTISVKTFGATTVVTGDPVASVEVAVQGKAVHVSGSPSIDKAAVRAQVSFDGGASWSSWVALGTLTSTNAEYLSGMRTWGRQSITREDLLDGNFFVRVEVSITSTSSAPRTTTVSLDGVRARATFNGTGNIPTSPYPGIVLTQGKQTFICSRNGEPPIGKTGCVFQGSLVTDDAGAPSNLRWSIPGDPEAFPTLYYLPIETPNNDIITYIGLVNNVCVVGLRNSIVRLNYLPSEDDANFSRTKIYDFISTSLGILHTKAACTFLTPGGRELLACITQDGVYVTDGYTISKWDHDFNFTDTILGANSDYFNPRTLQIVNELSSGNLLVSVLFGNGIFILPFNYAPRHIKDGPRFKVGLLLTGPPADTGVQQLACTTTNGIPVYYIAGVNSASCNISKLTNAGLATYTGTSATSSVQTRQITLSEGQDEAKINTVFLHGEGTAMTDTTISITTIIPNDTTEMTSTGRAFDTNSTVAQADVDFQGYQSIFTIHCTTAAVRKMNRLLIDYDISAQDK